MATLTETAIFALSADSSEYVRAMAAKTQADLKAIQSGEQLVASEERVTKASRDSVHALQSQADAQVRVLTELNNKVDRIRRQTETGQLDRGEAARLAGVFTAQANAQIAALNRTKEATNANVHSLDEYRARLEALNGSLSKQAGYEQARAARIKEANALLQAGTLSLRQHYDKVQEINNVYTQQVAALDRQTAALHKSATTTGLARHELINLGRQAQDVVVSLSSGQGFGTVLLQQGSQILDVFTSTRATMAQFFGQIATGARAALTPMGALIGVGGTIATVLGAAGVAAISFASGQKDVAQALMGVGRASGVTVGDINRIAEASAKAYGASTSEAREFATEIARSGRVAASQLELLTKQSKDISIVLGTDVAGAGKALSGVFSDPAAQIDALNGKLGQYSAKTVQLIKNLDAQGQATRAVQLVTEGLLKASEGAADKQVAGWTAVINKISEYWDWLGKVSARQLNLTKQDPAEGFKQAAEAVRALQEEQNLRASGAGSLEGRIKFGGDENLAAGLKAATEQARKFLVELGALQSESLQVAQNLRSLKDQAVIRSISPEIAQFEALNNQAKRLGDLLRDIQASGGAQSPLLDGLSATMDQVATAADRARQAVATFLQPAERATAEFRAQLDAINARTAGERQAVAEQQKALETAGQLLTVEERRVAIERAGALEVAKIAAAHRDAMAAMESQLAIASAVTGQEKLRATEIARTNALLREGYTASQAADQAAMERLVTQKQINASVEAQTRGIYEQIRYLQEVSQYGRDAADAAAAYRDAIRQGADHTVAAARAAATLELAMEKVQLAAEEAANSASRIGINAAKAAASAGDLGAKLDLIGTRQRPGGSFSGGSGSIGMLTGVGGFGPSATGVAPQYISTPKIDPLLVLLERNQKILPSLQGQQKQYFDNLTQTMAKSQQDAAQAATNAAQAAEDAARAQEAAAEAARQAAEELRQKNNEGFRNFAAAYLLQGMAPLAVNALIESGAIKRFDPSTTFQTQLDLYKRGGVSAARTKADILAGIIGEGVAPTELLDAIDSLTDAVTSNTDAQLGLSDFYTSQGNRLLGYRGYSVRSGGGGGAGTISSGTGTVGGAEPYGGQVNPLDPSSPYYDPVTGTYKDPLASGGTGGTGGGGGGGGAAPTILVRILNGRVVEGYYTSTGQWVTIADRGPYPGITKPADTYGTPIDQAYQNTLPTISGGLTNTIPNTTSTSSIIPTTLQQLYGQPTSLSTSSFYRFAEGGVVDRPTYGVFGEAGPEAFVPLKGGAIPAHLGGGLALELVKLMRETKGGGAAPTININAPLVNFLAEPARDDVRESAFQAAVGLRNVIARAAA